MARARGGKPWSQGGKYAWNPGRNTLKLDTSGLYDILAQVEALGGNVERVVENVLKDAVGQITNDTLAATIKPNFPARGVYSHGWTRDEIVQETEVHWEGRKAWMPVGFDFSKPGSGGYLITGTPKMQPVTELNKIYKQKRYMSVLQKQMLDHCYSILVNMWGNKK